MGLFGEKKICALCGGKVKGIFKNKVEGQYICNDCYGWVDLPQEVSDNMTIETFKTYCVFREENAKLKEKFVTSEIIDFGFFDTKLVFDYENKLLCLDKSLNQTIFEAKDIVSFAIKEDTQPLFEGSAKGLLCYASTVPERAAAMLPQVKHYIMMKNMKDQMERDGKEGGSYTSYTLDVPEPFRHFNLEIRFNHPYWYEKKADMDAPHFSDTYPRVDHYVRDYEEKVEVMKKLAHAFMKLAFEGAPEKNVAPGMGYAADVQTESVSSEDAATAIRKFKELLDQGLITEEEFNAKKRQILGI